jgi:class 3 adenylate cyclase
MQARPEAERCLLRIGLNTGRVLAGTIGSEARLDFTAVGEPVNIAAWLSSAAQPGQVLITGRTLASIGARFDVNPLGERPIRGAHERVALFEVLGEDVGDRTNPGMT